MILSLLVLGLLAWISGNILVLCFQLPINAMILLLQSFLQLEPPSPSRRRGPHRPSQSPRTASKVWSAGSRSPLRQIAKPMAPPAHDPPSPIENTATPIATWATEPKATPAEV